MKRLLIVLVLGTTLAVGAATPAWARATTKTLHIHNGTETFVDRVPCVPGKMTITITYNAVFHRTRIAPHLFHVTFTEEGTFSAVPLKPDRPSFTGRFTQWDGFNSNRKNVSGTGIFVVHGQGSDGSRVDFHEVFHFNTSASGLTVFFDKPTCS